MNKYENVDFDKSIEANNNWIRLLDAAKNMKDMEPIKKAVYHTRLFLEYIYTGFSRN